MFKLVGEDMSSFIMRLCIVSLCCFAVSTENIVAASEAQQKFKQDMRRGVTVISLMVVGSFIVAGYSTGVSRYDVYALPTFESGNSYYSENMRKPARAGDSHLLGRGQRGEIESVQKVPRVRVDNVVGRK